MAIKSVIEDVHVVAGALDEEHAHGVNVENRWTRRRFHGVEGDGLHMHGAVEGAVDAMAAGADEFGAKLPLIRQRIELAGGVAEFGIVHQFALRGGELKGGPVGIVVGVFEALIKMIATFAVAESGTEDLGPSLGFDGGVFVEDD